MSNRDHSTWHSPLEGRYASPEMKALFSDDKKFSTWRRLWVALAEAERGLGLPVTEEQIAVLRAHVDDINYDVAERIEREKRHDVVAHIAAYAEQCPEAKEIIHWGATSCFVTDNTDIVVMRDALNLTKRKLLEVVKNLTAFAEQYKELPTLGYTHGQPATPTTVGKRATLWLQNFMEDLEELEFVLGRMRLLGCRGATGTSETFMELFDGDEAMVKELDQRIAVAMGFKPDAVWRVSGQTYPRSFDVRVLNCLANIATSVHKMCTDIRLLQAFKELEEPFGEGQVGSSAMAYKRNPRRMSISESFLTTDALLIVAADVTNGLVVYPAMIRKRLEAELPFMVTEQILMRAVKGGGDRQVLHERIRVHSMAATKAVKECGEENNLIELILGDPAFSMLDPAEVADMLAPERMTGRCAGQVDDFLEGYVKLILNYYESFMEATTPTTELKV